MQPDNAVTNVHVAAYESPRIAATSGKQLAPFQVAAGVSLVNIDMLTAQATLKCMAQQCMLIIMPRCIVKLDFHWRVV